MPLSDEEQRLLEQMERALSEDDPKFASTLRGTRFARATRARIIVAGVVFVVGVAILLTGAILGGGGSSPAPGIIIGIVGFVLMLASATIGLSAYRGRQSAEHAEGQAPVPQEPQAGVTPGLRMIDGGRSGRKPRRSRSHGPSRDKASFMQRLEERWQKRRNQNGF